MEIQLFHKIHNLIDKNFSLLLINQIQLKNIPKYKN